MEDKEIDFRGRWEIARIPGADCKRHKSSEWIGREMSKYDIDKVAEYVFMMIKFQGLINLGLFLIAATALCLVVFKK